MDDSPDEISLERELDMPDDALGLGLAEGKVEVAKGSAYRVLARKYRPQTFQQLIGQEAMVQTLGNAIQRGRLAHAFLMTGVRGVGKTSTARLIAKALNCIGPDGQGGPTISPCGICEPCTAIAEGRHIDVREMDAASHTGVDDVREIIEAVRYSAVSARFKIFIIDEVHMLSKNAFNALLKTLEEPPAHVKFLFATTEVNKVPITVLSRCQRFDLKRITPELLVDNFRMICKAEGVEADEEALAIIANAAEGSARDGQSILDQAMAHADMDGGGRIVAAQVREMLGLSDRDTIRRLFGHILAGNVQETIGEAREQYRLGIEPLALIGGLMTEVHRITLTKIGAPVGDDLDEASVTFLEAQAEKLTFPVLHRLWQMLMKGHEEVGRASEPMDAAEMALLRILHGASLPDPGELMRIIAEGGPALAAAANAKGAAGPVGSDSAPASTATEAQILPTDFPALIRHLGQKGFLTIEERLHDQFRIVSYLPPKIEFQAVGTVETDFLNELRQALLNTTGTRWEITEAAGDAAPTLREIENKERAGRHQAMMNSPLVKAALEAFPDAEVHAEEHETSVWSKSA